MREHFIMFEKLERGSPARSRRAPARRLMAFAAAFNVAAATAHAQYDERPRDILHALEDRLSLRGVASATTLCQQVTEPVPAAAGGTAVDRQACRIALPFQPELSFRPTPRGQFFFKLGFAVDNGLASGSPWAAGTWAADLEATVRDINGRERDYLIAAWYRHQFDLGAAGRLSASLGILDATRYVDTNAYANDEYTQFLGGMFVNALPWALPTYDYGAALQWSGDRWSANAVLMDVGTNGAGRSWQFLGLQAGRRVDTPLGTGRYRLAIAGIPGSAAVEQRLAGWVVGVRMTAQFRARRGRRGAGSPPVRRRRFLSRAGVSSSGLRPATKNPARGRVL